MRRLLAAAAIAALLVAIGLQGRAPAPRALRSPAAVAASTAVARGKLAYEAYGCGMCHGADGKGGFSNANAETDGKVPAVIYVAEGYTRNELRRLILNGTPRIGKADPRGPVPPYRMPGWRDRMAEEDVTALVEYLMSLYPASAEDTWR